MRLLRVLILLQLAVVFLVPASYAEGYPASLSVGEKIKYQGVEEYLLDSLPHARLLPDNVFYFVKTMWERFRILTTFNPAKKARLYLKYAESRLSEALQIASVRNVYLSTKLIAVYDELMDRANEAFERANRKGIRIEDLGSIFSQSLDKRRTVVKKINERISRESRGVIEKTEKIRDEMDIATSSSGIIKVTPPQNMDDLELEVYDGNR